MSGPTAYVFMCGPDIPPECFKCSSRGTISCGIVLDKYGRICGEVMCKNHAQETEMWMVWSCGREHRVVLEEVAHA